VAAAISGIAAVGIVGLTVDLGRMYIAKSESDTFVDSVSLAATMELDGTLDGITRARQQLASNTNLWNFGRSTFPSTSISFAKDKLGPWDLNPVDATDYRYARAAASVPVPLFFMPLLKAGQGSPSVGGAPLGMLLATYNLTASVASDSAGGQEFRTSFREGLFPFSPFAHSTTAPHFGLIPGEVYTLRWASRPRLNKNVCPGDNTNAFIAIAEEAGGSERGYIEETSSAIIRKAIEQDYQTVFRSIGDPLDMTGGAKNTQRTSLTNRVNQDHDRSSATYAEYVAGQQGNGRRLVGVPINGGAPNFIMVQIGAFFLLPPHQYEEEHGNDAFCAEYVGPWLQGAKQKGAATAGAYVARLVKK